MEIQILGIKHQGDSLRSEWIRSWTYVV